MRRRLIFVAIFADVAVVLLTPASALAAMLVTLSSSHARPGDYVLLLTDDRRGTWSYAGLSAEHSQAIHLAPTTTDPAQACGGPGSQMIGKLQWLGNAAGLAFIVPNLPLANYWLFMETHSQCWRVVGAVGQLAAPLVLSIGTTPADSQDLAKRWTVDSLRPPTQSLATPKSLAEHSSTAQPWLGIAGVLVLVAIVVVASRFRER